MWYYYVLAIVLLLAWGWSVIVVFVLFPIIEDRTSTRGGRIMAKDMITEKKEIIVLELDENKITSDWWTPEVKELFCSLCKEDGIECNPMTCQVANPWCG